MIVWIVAIGLWAEHTQREPGWLIGGVIVITLPYLVEYHIRKRRWLDEVKRIDND